MVDLRVDDPRVPALVELGLPAVVVGGPLAGGMLPAVWNDEAVRRRRGDPVPRGTRPHADRPRGRATASSTTPSSGRDAFLAITARARAHRPRWSTPTTRRRAARGRPGSSCSRARPAHRDRLRQRRARGDRPRRRAPDGALACPDDVSIVAWDDSLDLPGRPPAADGDDARHHARTARPPRDGCSPRSTARAAGDVEQPRAELLPRGSTGPVRARRRHARFGDLGADAMPVDTEPDK